MKLYKKLIKKLSLYRTREKQFDLAAGFFKFVSFSGASLFVLVVLEAVFYFSPRIRTLLFVFFTPAVVIFFSFFFLLPLYKLLLRYHKPSLYEIAGTVGRFYENVNDKLVNALQLYKKTSRNKEHYSVSLINQALQNIGVRLENENFNRFISRRGLVRSIKYLVTACVLWTGLVLFYNPQPALFRLLHPRRDFSPLAHLTINVEPGDVEVLKGEKVEIKIWGDNFSLPGAELTFNRLGSTEKIAVTDSVGDSLYYSISSIVDSFSYYANYKTVFSDTFKVNVFELPFFRRITLQITPPAYSGISPYFLDENIGDINALKGTRVTLKGEANKPLQSAVLDFDRSKSIGLNTFGPKFEGRFYVIRNDRYTIKLCDKKEYGNIHPIKYNITVARDQSPFVRILVPGRDIDLGEDMRIPLLFEAQDDYGLSKMMLAYQILPQGLGEIDSSKFVFLELDGWQKDQEFVKLGLNWDVSSAELLPTDVLVYFIKVYDNDTVSGPKSAKSQIYRARFPSMYELYEEIADEHENATKTVQDVYEKALEVKQKIDDLAQEMKRNPELEWEERQELKDALKKKKQMQKDLEKASRDLDAMVEKMQKNDLVSVETLNKYQELQNLFQEIMTPELQQTMKKVAQAMENVDQQMLQKAMQDLKLNEEEFRKSIERTISLLKKLKMEQELDKALHMAKDLAERQEKLSSADAENYNQEDQQEVARDADKLSDLLEQLSGDMSDMPTMPKENIDSAQAQLDSLNMQKKAQQMSEMMKNNQGQTAQKMSRQMQSSLSNIADQLQQAMDQMSGAEMKKAMQAMRSGSRQLLQLSMDQEALMSETGSAPKSSSKSLEVAEKQSYMSDALSRVINKMYETSKQNIFLDQKINQSLGKAAQNMESAIRNMEQGNNPQAVNNQADAMASLNNAVNRIQNSMENMMQNCSGNSGMSMEQFMQQMKQMANMQQGINQQTLGMGLGQQMSMAQQAAAARLAAEQQQVRKSLEQLAQEAGDTGEILGRLDKIADDMKKVEQDFAQKNISRETIERQNKILSRMLDAQKSIREREYSNKRRGETADNYLVKNPGPLPEDLGERKNQMQQDLLRAPREGYTRDYLDLVKKYFDAIGKYGRENE